GRAASRLRQRPLEGPGLAPAGQDLVFEGGQVDLRGERREWRHRPRLTHPCRPRFASRSSANYPPLMPAEPRHAAADLPVRPGEEPWTEEELKQVRAELEAEAAALQADLAKAAAQAADRLADSVRDAGDDSADAGTKAFEREQELSLNQNARD